MKTDIDKLQLEKTGKKSDGKRFGFLNSLTKGLDKMLQKANHMMHDIDESKPYHVDFNLVDSEYLKVGRGDIDEFSNNHAFGLSMMQGFMKDKVAQHACYEEIREYLWNKKKRGEIE